MELTTTEDGKTTIITTCESRIDAVNATRFKDVVREIITDRGKPALLDLQHVDFMDSSGLGALIAVHKAMPPGLSLTLANITPNVERVFKLTRMDSVFHILPPQRQQENG
ncbi:STAS domain-containing protein [Paracoccus saliphilus]|uniref:Anti-sigma factor antagonist n=1 Tax=Paracoccus saliphilus TaxID=405559 RepID=A0AA45W166_9RHOB|nr:STAS domain-containing protein [Paracoccus saliphilus]WCR03497.1 STAS domain-containing protein [Paracoccus saliphilus]SIS54739.1 anti-sigma B factor antagonist [Paracoccus saliphilus]